MIDEILQQDVSDMEKLKLAFGQITGEFLENEKNQLELNKALDDDAETVKSHIKIGVMTTAREIFDLCYIQISRKGET